MNKTVIILLSTAAVGTVVFGGIHLIRSSNAADSLDINLESFGIKSAGFNGADGLGNIKLNPKVVFSADVKVNNPTSTDLHISKPYLKVFYNGKQIGSSVPSTENINLAGRQATPIKDMEIEFYALDVVPVMPDFITYIASRFAGAPSTRKVRVDMLVTGNGISKTETKEIAL